MLFYNEVLLPHNTTGYSNSHWFRIISLKLCFKKIYKTSLFINPIFYLSPLSLFFPPSPPPFVSIMSCFQYSMRSHIHLLFRIQLDMICVVGRLDAWPLEPGMVCLRTLLSLGELSPHIQLLPSSGHVTWLGKLTDMLKLRNFFTHFHDLYITLNMLPCSLYYIS